MAETPKPAPAKRKPAVPATLTIRLEGSVHQAAIRQARRKGREVGEYCTWLITRGLIEDAAFQAGEAERLKLREDLVQELVDLAVKVNDEGFRADITGEACRRAVQNPDWKTRYERFLGGADAFASGVALKSRINPRFGARVRARLGLRAAKRADGSPDTYSLTGSIIQQATNLKKPDATA